jgi:hypothetical protein
VVRAAAHGLHRRPHVTAVRKQIPPRRYELVAADAIAVVHGLRPRRETIGNDLRPDQIAVAAHDGVRRARQDVQSARRDHGDTEGTGAGHRMNAGH